METITAKAGQSTYRNIECYYNPTDVLFFDIETTGFSPEHSVLYLIGCGYYADDCLHIIQWFNDDGESEAAVLSAFLAFAANYRYLLHYNGDGFDIPYLAKKCETSGFENGLAALTSVDLYKIIKPFKKRLHLDNLKLKSVEQFLGIRRIDQYSGKDLIQIYQNYVKHPDNENKRLLLQHNFEDVEGLTDCFCMLGYPALKEGRYTLEKMSVRESKLVFSLALEKELPKRIAFGESGITVTAHKHAATMQVPIVFDTLKFYFPNHREYYYLPAEDMAVHKSVAGYVDKHYRITATKENCYVKKEGYFVTQLDKTVVTGYKIDLTDRYSYIELVDSFLKDKELLTKYVRCMMERLL